MYASFVAVVVLVGTCAGLDLATIGKKCGKKYSDRLVDRKKGLMNFINATKLGEQKTICAALNYTSRGNCPGCVECDSKCFARMDESNPCYKDQLEMLLVGVTEAKSVSGRTPAAFDKLKAKYNACSTSTKAACTNSVVCSWCSKTTKCHNKGSPQNECMMDALKMFAMDGVTKAKGTLTSAQKTAQVQLQKAANATRKKFAAQQARCLGFNDTKTCYDDWRCMWCSKADDKDVNNCYFTGDTGNPCISQHLGKITDAAGKVQDAGKWMMSKANETWTDMKNWGSNICGKHDGTNTSCTAATACSWCKDNNKCYIYGSVNNPCGMKKYLDKAKAGMANAWAGVKSWWTGSESGSACTADIVETGKKVREQADAAQKNLNMACEHLANTQAFAERTYMASLLFNKTSQDADADEALSLTNSMEVYSAALAVKATTEAISEHNETMTALDSFKANNPNCTTKTSNAVQSASAVLVLSVATFFL